MGFVRTIAAAAGWLACVIGAAQGQPLAGPALVTVILLWHAWTLPDALRQVRPVLVLGVVGTLLESGVIGAGAYVPREAMRATSFAPLWITALWINAAVWLQSVVVQRNAGESPGGWLLAALAGAVASVAAYAGAAWLHAIAVNWSAPAEIAAAAAYGAVVTPVALWLIRGPQSRFSPGPTSPSHESTHG